MKTLQITFLFTTLFIYNDIFAQTSRNYRDEAGHSLVMNPNLLMLWGVIISVVIGAVVGYFLSNSPKVNTTKLNGVFFGVVGGLVLGVLFGILFGENPYSNDIVQKNLTLTGTGAFIGSLGLPILLNFLKGDKH